MSSTMAQRTKKMRAAILATVIAMGPAMAWAADTVSYEYDTLNRLTRVTYASGTVIELVDDRLSTGCPSTLGRRRDNNNDNGVKYYQEQSTKSAEFKQIQKLLVKSCDKK